MKYKISISIMVYFILIIILVLNMEDRSKIIKNSFLIFMCALVTALFLVNELVMDYIMSVILRYIYFPTFASIILTVMVTLVIFIKNILNDNASDKRRIINYIFSSFIFIAYVIFMLLDVDINSSTALYQGDSLNCLRYISRTFILWMMTNGVIEYFNCLLKKYRK